MQASKGKSSYHSVWVMLWFYRCSYAQLCYYILEDGSLTSEQFANELLPSLLSLGSDRIPNVRIALAKVLAQHIMHSGQSPQPHPQPRQGAGTAHHALRSVPSTSPSPRCWHSTSCTQVSPPNLTLSKVLAQHISSILKFVSWKRSYCSRH